MADENIVQLFVTAAAAHPQRLALITGSNPITYKQLLQQVQATAFSFSKKNIRKNDKVLVFIPVKTDLYITVLALLYIGACPVFLDEWVSISRLKACLKTVPCTAIIAERKLVFISWFIAPLRKLKKIIPHHAIGFTNSVAPASTKASDTALVTFTTGSTSLPKAANRTHAFLSAQRLALMPLIESDFTTTITLLPIVVLLNLSAGKTNVLPVRKLKPQRTSSVKYLLQLIQQQATESIIASPAVTIALAKYVIGQKITTDIKHVVTGGGPVFPDDATIIMTAFPQANATAVYGSTEAEPISTITMQQLANTTADMMQDYGLQVGKLHSAISVAIVPFIAAPIPNQSAVDWEQYKLQPGSSGEIVVSGPHVLQAYINNDAAQRQHKFFVDDILWHRTGDEGLVDEHGNLYFQGRCTEVIMHQGQTIYPLISTWLLKQKVPINEAAVLLMNDELILVLEKKDKQLHEEILNAFPDTLLRGATIRYLPIIPKDKRHQTKIDYAKLRHLLSQ